MKSEVGNALASWKACVVKTSTAREFIVDCEGTTIKFPSEFVSFEAREGDTIFLKIANAEQKQEEQKDLTKKILNIILDHGGKKQKDSA